MCILVFFVSSAHYKKVQSFSLYFLYFLGKQQYGFLKAIKRGISFFNIHVHNISFFFIWFALKNYDLVFSRKILQPFLSSKKGPFFAQIFLVQRFHQSFSIGKNCFLTINKKSFIKNVYPNYYQLIPSFILVSI